MWWAKVVSATSGICRARSAICWSGVDTVCELGVSPMCPSSNPVSRPLPSLRWVLWDEFPTFLGPLEPLRRLAVLSAALRCLRPTALLSCSTFVSPTGTSTSLCGPGDGIRVTPIRRQRRHDGASQVPEIPPYGHALFCDLGGIKTPGIAVPRCGLR